MKTATWRPNLNGMSFEQLDSSVARCLERPFEENKVFQMVKGLCKDKVFGPYSFFIAFSRVLEYNRSTGDAGFP